MASTLSVAKAVTLGSTLTVNNDVTINGELVVTGGLTVSGTVALDGCSGFTCTSDRRLKRHISPLENALSKISSLRGVYFSWVNDEVSGIAFDSERHIGLMAQDVNKVIPEAVVSMHDGKYLGVDYQSLIPYLIEAIRTMRKEFQESLEEEEVKNSKDNDFLANKIAALERASAEHESLIRELQKSIKLLQGN
jgi:hypothetical protein